MTGIANPTISAAAMAALNPPDSYIAPFLFPRVPVIGAALKPGDNTYRGTAYRVVKKAAVGVDEISDVYQPGVKPNTVRADLEDYELTAALYSLDHEQPLAGMKTMDRYGIDNYAGEVAVPLVFEQLLLRRERRAVTVATTTGNFGGNSAEDWTDDTVDPIESIQDALLTIGPLFIPGPQNVWRMAFGPAAWKAFINNAKVRARFKTTSDSPTTPAQVLEYLTGTMQLGGKNGLEIMIASAVAAAGNVGQDPAAAYLFNNKCALVASTRATATPITDAAASAALKTQADSALRIRTWGRGYSMLDPNVRVLEVEERDVMVFRGEHATTDTVVDSTGGYLWTAPAGA